MKRDVYWLMPKSILVVDFKEYQCKHMYVNVFSHLLSAAFKMTSSPLHVSVGILVTRETQ